MAAGRAGSLPRGRRPLLDSAPSMRRLFFVLLLVLLPLQWSWAAAGSVCAHESGTTTHFGHHAHQHRDATPNDATDDATFGHHDCSVCQALGAAFTPAHDAMTFAAAPESFGAYRSRVDQRYPEGLLRPPHARAG